MAFSSPSHYYTLLDESAYHFQKETLFLYKIDSVYSMISNFGEECMEKKRILVVDDEAAILLAFKKLLQRPEVQIDTCESLEDAIRYIDLFYYDAAIADLRLSGSLGQEGFQIISYLKKKSPSAKAALITAYGMNGTERNAFSNGADFYFEKPVSFKDLNLILNSIGVE